MYFYCRIFEIDSRRDEERLSDERVGSNVRKGGRGSIPFGVRRNQAVAQAGVGIHPHQSCFPHIVYFHRHSFALLRCTTAGAQAPDPHLAQLLNRNHSDTLASYFLHYLNSKGVGSVRRPPRLLHLRRPDWRTRLRLGLAGRWKTQHFVDDGGVYGGGIGGRGGRQGGGG